jgi:hypothetical protein
MKRNSTRRDSPPNVHRQAGSHALATITSGLLVAYYKDYLYVFVKGLRRVSWWLVTTYELPFTGATMTSVLLASALSACWGIVFHYAHR